MAFRTSGRHLDVQQRSEQRPVRVAALRPAGELGGAGLDDLAAPRGDDHRHQRRRALGLGEHEALPAQGAADALQAESRLGAEDVRAEPPGRRLRLEARGLPGGPSSFVSIAPLRLRGAYSWLHDTQ